MTESTDTKKTASAVTLKQYFGYPDAKTFATDWKQLTAEDKVELLAGLQVEIDSGRWTP